MVETGIQVQFGAHRAPHERAIEASRMPIKNSKSRRAGAQHQCVYGYDWINPAAQRRPSTANGWSSPTGGSNGTYVNGQRLTRLAFRRPNTDDSLVFGAARFGRIDRSHLGRIKDSVPVAAKDQRWSSTGSFFSSSSLSRDSLVNDGLTGETDVRGLLTSAPSREFLGKAAKTPERTD
jgi:hypothetical protein